MMFRNVVLVGARFYRTKGAKNKSTVRLELLNSTNPDGPHASGKTRKTPASKKTVKITSLLSEELPTPSNINSEPSLFTTIHTEHGWVAIPKKCYSFKWTKHQIEDRIHAQYGDKAPALTEVQELVCEWAKSVNLTEVPKTEKTTAKELAQVKEDALYRSQLKYDIYDVSGNRTGIRNKRPFLEKTTDGDNRTVIRGTVNFTHAWNYFYSVTYPEYSHLPQGQGTKKVSALWNDMKMDEKEIFRQKYADLLKEGKDIYKGQVISVEEKMKINQTFNKYKETQRAKVAAREEKIAKIIANEQERETA